MSIFSFIILESKSLAIEKDRYRKHDFIKKENDFYIYSRQQAPSLLDKSRHLNSNFLNFIVKISDEIKSDIFFSIRDLQDRESEMSISNLTHQSIPLPTSRHINLGLIYRYIREDDL